MTMTTTEKMIGYSVEVTPDFRLLVNDQEIEPRFPNGRRGPEADSEWALEWALEQVSAKHIQHDKPMRLTIRDRRHGGYGSKRVVLPPGKIVDIEALRKRSQRTYPIPASQQASPQPPVQSEPGTGETFSQPHSMPPPTEAPPPPRGPMPTSPPPPAPPNIYPSPGPSWGTPLDLGTEANDDESSMGSLDAFFGPGAVQEDTKQAKRDRRRAERARKKSSQKAKSGSARRGLSLKRKSDGQSASTAPVTTPVEHDEQSRKKGWTRYTRVIPRPGLKQAGDSSGPTAVNTAVEDGPSPTRRHRLRNAVLVILGIVAVFVAVRLMNAPTGEYAAVCVDSRTMSRQSSTAACQDGEATYYRWWYVGSGDKAPAVGGRVDEGTGSFSKPNDDATVDYEFAEDGGVVAEE